MLVVGVVLSLVAFFFSNDLAGWLTAAAILATFGHTQIGDRMQERQSLMETPSVECHWKMNYYFVGKEVLWITMFLVVQNYPAIIGSALFIAYPHWRKWYRKRNPIGELVKSDEEVFIETLTKEDSDGGWDLLEVQAIYEGIELAKRIKASGSSPCLDSSLIAKGFDWQAKRIIETDERA